jgi:LacI family transcriptional regulator
MCFGAVHGDAMTVTMRDVADLAQVSTMTVSRVLNGAPGVATETAEAVMAAVEATGYRKNELARSLRPGQRSKMIALVIGDVANPFYAVLAQSVENYARQLNYVTVIFNTNEDPEVERRGLNDLLARRVDGLLLVSSDTDHSYLATDIEAGTGIVFVDRPPVGLVADAVVVDNRSGVRAATTELIRRGNKRIGYIGDYERLFTASERLAGYVAALSDGHLKRADDLIQMGIHTVADSDATATRWLTSDSPPTAIVAGNNLLATGAANAIQRHAPTTMLIGFDELPGTQVDITVGFDVAALGATAARMLFERLDGTDRVPTIEVLPTALHVANPTER